MDLFFAFLKWIWKFPKESVENVILLLRKAQPKDTGGLYIVSNIFNGIGNHFYSSDSQYF